MSSRHVATEAGRREVTEMVLAGAGHSEAWAQVLERGYEGLLA
jgi:hypothetical protein